MRSPERKKWLAVPLAIALGLGLTACGSSSEQSNPNTTESLRTEDTHEGALFDVKRTFQDGVMVTEIQIGDSVDSTIRSFCVGSDLVEYNDIVHGGGMARSANHPACADDGQLTLEEFPTAQNMATTTTTLG